MQIFLSYKQINSPTKVFHEVLLDLKTKIYLLLLLLLLSNWLRIASHTFTFKIGSAERAQTKEYAKILPTSGGIFEFFM